MSFYLLDKPKDISSNKALSSLKKNINVKKAGFSGVLDPFATGLLICATNGDTKFLDRFLFSNKTYEGIIAFGFRTDTLDVDGQTISERNDFFISKEKLEDLIKEKFIGEINQIPPNFSNIKVNGERAHKLSRKNIEVKLKPVKRKIFNFQIISFKDNKLKFVVEVSSGTYIRSISRDIGDMLDIPTTLIELRRTMIGNIKTPKVSKNKNFIEVKRKDVLDILEKDVDQVIFKNLLDGKEENIDSTFDELIVKFNDGELLINRTKGNFFKIKKRIN